MEQNNDNYEQLINDCEEWVTTEQNLQNEKLIPLTKKISSNSPSDIDRLQSESIEIYMKVLLDISEFEILLYALKSNRSILNQNRIMSYALNKSLKVTVPEKKALIEGDAALINRHIGIVESHINFLRDTKLFINNIQYSISNKIKLMSL